MEQLSTSSLGEVKYVDAVLYYNPSVLAGTSWAVNIYI